MKSDLLSKADESITLVELQLTKISQLTAEANQLTAKLEELKQSESQIIQSEDKKRVEKLIKIRAEIDCATADAARANAELATAKDEIFPLAGAANNDLHAVRDELLEQKKADVRKLLLQVFEEKAVQLLGAWINHAKPVKALDFDRLIFSRSQVEKNVAAAGKLRSQLTFLVTGEWPVRQPAVEAPELVQLVPEPAGNQLGALL